MLSGFVQVTKRFVWIFNAPWPTSSWSLPRATTMPHWSPSLKCVHGMLLPKSRQISAMGILERLRLLRSDLRLRVYIWGKVWSNHVENQNPGNSDLHIGADLQWWICATRFSLEAVTEISLLHQNFQIWLLISETKVQMQPRLPPQS